MPETWPTFITTSWSSSGLTAHVRQKLTQQGVPLKGITSLKTLLSPEQCTIVEQTMGS